MHGTDCFLQKNTANQKQKQTQIATQFVLEQLQTCARPCLAHFHVSRNLDKVGFGKVLASMLMLRHCSSRRRKQQHGRTFVTKT